MMTGRTVPATRAVGAGAEYGLTDSGQVKTSPAASETEMIA